MRQSERDEAKKLFGSPEAPTTLATKISRAKSTHSFASATANGDSAATRRGDGGGELRIKLTPEERKRVERLALRAKSEDEIRRLEVLLEQGKVPGEELET